MEFLELSSSKPVLECHVIMLNYIFLYEQSPTCFALISMTKKSYAFFLLLLAELSNIQKYCTRRFCMVNNGFQIQNAYFICQSDHLGCAVNNGEKQCNAN